MGFFSSLLKRGRVPHTESTSCPPPTEGTQSVPHTESTKCPPPAPTEARAGTSSTVTQAGDHPRSVRFTWTVEKFSEYKTKKKFYSDFFCVRGCKWRIIMYPEGNNVDCLSLYLDAWPCDRSRYAVFSLSVLDQMNPKFSIRKETQHLFNAPESAWGFASFMPLRELYKPRRGYLVNDTCVVVADIEVLEMVDFCSYDSKKETGYVGLENQEATCYVNSLLQTLYHIPNFRKAVYHMPTTENDIPTGSMPLALQSLFYKLQYSETSVATKELTESFGWDTCDSSMQRDVQVLNRILREKLEDKMQGTVVEGTTQQLFEGHRMDYIECINEYKLTSKISFYDLQLDVKGCRDVYASFDKYVEVKRLEGDNRYHADQDGLQDAKKGVLFINFPSVLQLWIKSFGYDFMQETTVKINGHYEFPLQLDLDRDNGKYLSPEADRNVRNLYTLHSVLVHSGGVDGGHNYVYIRPTLTDQWFKFDDERVTKENMKRAWEEQDGGEVELPRTNPGFKDSPCKVTLNYSNAYMLVYIRESDKDKIICAVDEEDIAGHLRVRLTKEIKEEKKRKNKAEATFYSIIKVVRDKDLFGQIGKEIYLDLVDHDNVQSFLVQKRMPFLLFKGVFAKEFGIPVQNQRFWLWAKRQNNTYHPHRPLTWREEANSVEQLSRKANDTELKLFLEVERRQDLFFMPANTEGRILLFFKLYDPSKEEFRYVGRLYVNRKSEPVQILSELNEMAGFHPYEEIDLFKETDLGPDVMFQHVDKECTFRDSRLQDGDVIFFQKSAVAIVERYRFPDVPSCMEYVYYGQKDEKEKKGEEKGEAHLYTILIKVARDEDLFHQIGEEIYLNLVDHDRVQSFRVKKQMLFESFKREVAKEFGIPFQYQRFWLWRELGCCTSRPYRPLTSQEEVQPVGLLSEVSYKAGSAELKLFLEIEQGQDLRPIPFPEKTVKDILLFFKLYDPSEEKLGYVGRLFVKGNSKPVEILSKLNEMASFTPNQKNHLFKENGLGPNVMFESVDRKCTFDASGLRDGDILCFQKSAEVASAEQYRFPDVPSYMEYVYNGQEEEKEKQSEEEGDEQAEARLNTILIKVACDKDLFDQIGKELCFDLVDHDKVRSFRVRKGMLFHRFRRQVAKQFGIPVQCQRFWLWAERRNNTYRPDRPLTPQEEAQPVGLLSEVSNKASKAELNLFLEVEQGEGFQSVPLSEKTREDILLFFKLYDPSKEELRYVGRLFVKRHSKPVDILSKLNKMAGFSPDEEIHLFEEIKFEPIVICEHVDKNFTFRRSQLQDGDILCFQKSLEVGSAEQYRYPDVPSFMKCGPIRQACGAALLNRLKRFSTMNRLKKMASQVISEGLSEEEIDGFKGVFKMMDTDNSGQINLEELRAGLKWMGVNLVESEVVDLMQTVDLDRSGTIKCSEFIAAMLDLNEIDRVDNLPGAFKRDDRLFTAFKYFDKDGNGYITKDELERACEEFGTECTGVEEMIKDIDLDDDGLISFNDFGVMMEQENP